MKALKNGFLVMFFLFGSFAVFSQSSLGWTNQEANLRSGPGTNFEIVKTLPADSQILIYSLDEENGFYKVKDIATDTNGYILKSLVKLDQVTEGSKPNEKPKKSFWLDENHENKSYMPAFIANMVARGFWMAILASVIFSVFFYFIGFIVGKIDMIMGAFISYLPSALFIFYIWRIREHKGWLVYAIISLIGAIFLIFGAIKAKVDKEK